MNEHQPKPTEEGWFDRKENFRKVLTGLFGASAFFVLLDVVLWLIRFDKHPYFKWEQWPGFYAIFGFVSCALLVLIARFVLRPLVKRDEDYYSRSSRKGGNDA